MDRSVQQMSATRDQQLTSLKIITTNISQFSILTILDIYKTSSDTAEILLDIRSSQYGYSQSKSKKKNKNKQYKIKYDIMKFQQVISAVKAYPLVKAKITSSNWELLVESFRDFNFKSMIIDQVTQNISSNIEKISAQQYHFNTPLQISSIGKIYEKIQKNAKNQNKKVLQVEFNVKKGPQKLKQIISIIQHWSSLCNVECQLQKLSICSDGQLLICLQNKQLYGISICLYKQSGNVEFCINLLQIFVKNPYSFFVSIQFLDWIPSNSVLVNYVFANYTHHNKYLIKFGNYLEITELRLFINTTGMKKNQVADIFNLMRQPGHYELICHSNKQFFQEAIRIFLYKPLIKFKYFVPLSQSQELQSPIEAMVTKADMLRKKLQVFMGMLKNPCQMDLSTIIKVFFTMSKTNFI